MHLVFYSAVLLFATSCASQKEHLVPKHGIESKDVGTKGLSAAEVEGILKTLSKLERHDDSDVALKYADYDKAIYPEEKLLAEKERVSKGSVAYEKSGKIAEAAEDKFSDKDVSLIESLYHMKIAADVETYPYHKMAQMKELPEKSLEEDKFKLAKDHIADETYLKKIDEIEKSASKDKFATHLVDDNIEGHLKKAMLEDKSLSYDPKIIHPDGSYKIDQDKALEEWKVSHDDLFKIQGGIFPEEIHKIEAPHHLDGIAAHELNEDLNKKLKASSVVDMELKTKHAHVAEGSLVHEMNDGYAKKMKESLGFDKDLMMDGSHIAESGIAYKIDEDLLKKLKGLSEEELKIAAAHIEKSGFAHEEDEELLKKMKSLDLDEELKIKGPHYLEGGIAHGLNDELVKKLKESHGLDEKLAMGSAHVAGDGIAHEMNEELWKKMKMHADLDKEFGSEEAHYLASGIAHDIDSGFSKKAKENLGFDKGREELLYFSKELQREKSIDEGSSAYEKAIEQAHKDTHAHLGEEALKKHLDEALGFGAKEIVHGKDLMFEKDLTAGKAHEISTKIGSGLDKSLHATIGDEMKKTKLFDESLGYAKEKAVFGSKLPVEGEIKHTIGHDMYASEADKAFKMHEDRHIHGFDEALGYEKEKAVFGSKKGVKHAMGHDIFAAEEDKAFKIHEDKHAFDEAVNFGKEKAILGSKEGVKQAMGHDIYASEADKAFKIHEDKHIHGFDEALGYEKEKAAFGSKEGVKHAVGHDIYASEAEKAFKIHEDKHAFDEAVSFGKEKAVFGSKEGVKHAVGHDIFATEADKTFKIHEDKHAHAFDESLGFGKEKAIYGSKVPMEEGMKHAVGHDIYAAEVDKAFKFHEDELLKKEKAYEAGSHIHKDKEVIDSAVKHHILKSEPTHIFHGPEGEKHLIESGTEHKDLKTKLMELLRRVLHIRKCHLVTMRPGELLGIVRCISSRKDPRLCEKFAACEKKMPLRVKATLEKCMKEIIPGGAKKCTREAPLYSSPEIPLKIFQCVAINVRELIIPQEKKEMADFEECARYVKAGNCGRLPWFRGVH